MTKFKYHKMPEKLFCGELRGHLRMDYMAMDENAVRWSICKDMDGKYPNEATIEEAWQRAQRAGWKIFQVTIRKVIE
jgi:hypothetical protein